MSLVLKNTQVLLKFSLLELKATLPAFKAIFLAFKATFLAFKATFPVFNTGNVALKATEIVSKDVVHGPRMGLTGGSPKLRRTN